MVKSIAIDPASTTLTVGGESKAPKTQDSIPVVWYILLVLAGGLVLVGKKSKND